MKHNVLQNIQKIAVLRAIALGDFIIALPALSALRKAYSHTQIYLLCRPWVQELGKGRNLPFDHVVPVPVSRGVYDEPGLKENEQELQQFFKKQQQQKYDIAIQLHGGGQNSNVFVNKLNAKVSVGMRTPDAPLLKKWIPYSLYQHEIFRYLEVVSLIGAEPVTVVPEIPVIEQDIKAAAQILSKTENDLIILHPGASDSRRTWPPEKFAELGDRLAMQGYTIVLTGTHPEQSIVDQVENSMKHKPINICGKTNFNSLIGLMHQAKVVISNDTGPLHLARAIGTPTVGVYWFPNMIHWSPITRKQNETAISWLQRCEICHEPLFDIHSQIPLNEIEVCGHMKSYVDMIPVDDVYQKTESILSAH